jgi:hypothetical protein
LDIEWVRSNAGFIKDELNSEHSEEECTKCDREDEDYVIYYCEKHKVMYEMFDGLIMFMKALNKWEKLEMENN